MKRKNTIMRKSINEKYILLLSHLTRGAWIEILTPYAEYRRHTSHLTRGAWIEIILNWTEKNTPRSRTSHEVRGLKYRRLKKCKLTVKSHLTRGAWIEI